MFSLSFFGWKKLYCFGQLDCSDMNLIEFSPLIPGLVSSSSVLDTRVCCLGFCWVHWLTLPYTQSLACPCLKRRLVTSQTTSKSSWPDSQSSLAPQLCTWVHFSRLSFCARLVSLLCNPGAGGHGPCCRIISSRILELNHRIFRINTILHTWSCLNQFNHISMFNF